MKLPILLFLVIIKIRVYWAFD